MKYLLELDILSLAPQLVNKQLKVGKHVLKNAGYVIDDKSIKKCIKSLFPALSLVSIKSLNIEQSEFRQKITLEATSLRQPSKELIIIGIQPDFYKFKVSKLDAQ